VEQAAVATPATVAAAATAAKQTAMAAAAAAATVATKRIGLGLQADQDDEHGRQSQRHLKDTSFHQKYLRNRMDNKWNFNSCPKCAMVKSQSVERASSRFAIAPTS